MLRKFWRWLVGEPERSDISIMLESLMDNQAKSQKLLFEAVAQIGDASQKQAEVLNSYLKLFQTPGEPTTWKADPEAENAADLEKMGFPKDASDAEQASWVLEHIGEL